MRRIYSEVPEKERDNMKLDQLRELVGWLEFDEQRNVWDVTVMMEDGFHTCEDQTEAQILASLEEIKAKLFQTKGEKNEKM